MSDKFVYHFYQPHRLDTQQALRKFHQRIGLATAGADISRHQLKTEGSRLKAQVQRLRWVAVAASLLVLVAAGAWWWTSWRTTELVANNASTVYTLDDGTRVTLAPHATLVYCGNDCRRVTMTGKAYFEVKHDAAHPFLIDGERSHVQVLGTKFQVDESGRGSSVYVVSGKVLFTAPGSSSGVFLTQGQQAVLGQGSKRPVVQQPRPEQVVWATHEFHFDDTPLPEVLRQLSAVYGHAFTASATNKRLTGDFDATDEQQVISIIEQTLGVDIDND